VLPGPACAARPGWPQRGHGQRETRADLDLAQARLVSAWCDDVQPAPGAVRDLIMVTLQNSSHEPIYALRLAAGAEWTRMETMWAEPEKVKDVIEPQYRGQHEIRLRLSRSPGGDHVLSPPVEILFMDAGRRFWHRDRYGRSSALN
jgi:hypothetical protein